jgi:hypothetical protein
MQVKWLVCLGIRTDEEVFEEPSGMSFKGKEIIHERHALFHYSMLAPLFEHRPTLCGFEFSARISC